MRGAAEGWSDPLEDPDQGRETAADRICRATLASVVQEGYHDDVLLLAARRSTTTRSAFDIELPAGPGVLADLRRGLGRWLDGMAAEPRDMHAIQLAVGEAVTNSIEHGYQGGTGTVRVEAYHDADGRICVTVSDYGRWRPPPGEPNGRGRGLIMMRGCMDTVEVEEHGSGTAVLMDLHLRREPVFVTGPELAPREHTPLVTVAHRSVWPCLEVVGPVDGVTAPRFRARLADAGRGGALSLNVDLTRVTVLASPGVQALYELLEQMTAEGRALRLIAPAGSPAHSVLELTGLAHLIVVDAPPLAS